MMEFLSEPEELNENLELPNKAELLDEDVTIEHFGLHPEGYEFSEETEPLENPETIFGNPEQDMENWHQQNEMNSCAVACQEFVSEQLLEREFSEKELAEFAESNGWYNPETGTPLNDVGNILEALGLNVERSFDGSIQDIAERLNSGEKIICTVNSLALNMPEMAPLPGLSADHAVEVIGIDAANPNDIRVILNDPAAKSGGTEYPLNTFMDAWDTGGRFMAAVWK